MKVIVQQVLQVSSQTASLQLNFEFWGMVSNTQRTFLLAVRGPMGFVAADVTPALNQEDANSQELRHLTRTGTTRARAEDLGAP